jgi:hypothetical protein
MLPLSLHETSVPASLGPCIVICGNRMELSADVKKMWPPVALEC